MHSNPTSQFAIAAVGALLLAIPAAGLAEIAIPPDADAALRAGRPVQLIVEYRSAAVDRDAGLLRQQLGVQYDDDRVVRMRRTRYANIKQTIHSRLNTDSDVAVEYPHLPMSARNFRTLAGLKALAAQPDVKAIFPVRRYAHVLAHSLPLIGQPAAAAAGAAGRGSTVAVLDDGINVANAAFSPCTAANVPAGCPVAVSLTFGTGTTNTDHGTNVAAIVLGVAPGARIAALNVFSGTSASSVDIIAALDWVIANRSTYGIAAANMSLGDASANTSPCGDGTVNPFVTPFANVHAAGVAVVVAAGNGAFSNALANPACTPLAVSVGAVYSTNWGSVGYGVCSDATTASDQVTCFSNSAGFLTLLAPGAIITAGGLAEAGTSQAAPHVAGAIAVLRAAVPTDSPDQAVARLTASGKPIADPRNGVVKPRLDLGAAVAALSSAGSADVPALPGWAALALGASLLWIVRPGVRR